MFTHGHGHVHKLKKLVRTANLPDFMRLLPGHKNDLERGAPVLNFFYLRKGPRYWLFTAGRHQEQNKLHYWCSKTLKQVSCRLKGERPVNFERILSSYNINAKPID
jgi:hypothetical protein